jgi:hypothetical protein
MTKELFRVPQLERPHRQRRGGDQRLARHGRISR